MTLYLDLGGRAALNRALTRLESRLRLDPVFKHAITRLDPREQEDLGEFIAYLLGGAPIYEGCSPKQIIGQLCDCHHTFEHFIDHVVTVLIGRDGTLGREIELRMHLDPMRMLVLNEQGKPPERKLFSRKPDGRPPRPGDPLPQLDA